MFKQVSLFLSLCMLFAPFVNAQDESRLLRFPAMSADQVVFTWAGDLYSVSRDGGVARKLTSHDGFEMFARFSPDGSQVAFTGQYDGNTEVYLMPATGGVPQRLTYTATLDRDDVADRMGPNNITMGWTPDGKRIVFRSRKTTFNPFKGMIYTIPVAGGMETRIPLATAGFCSFNADGSKLAFNKVFREFRTWKYYRGGMADDIMIFDVKKKTFETITDNPAQDIIPMWIDDKIYFLSDHDRTMNLFEYDTKTKQTRKLTDFTEFDIKFPSAGPGGIIFENGGYLHIFNIEDESITRLHITIADDLAEGRDYFVDASENITSYDISPDGARITITARGDLFTLPAEKGITRNLTQSPGVHERNTAWSPDGEWLAYVSDETGENEVHIRPQSGKGEARQLTFNNDTYKYQPKWSPDSKKVLWSDKKQRLQFVDVETGKTTLVDEAGWEIRSYNWSPDSKWIAYSLPKPGAYSMVMLYELETGKSYAVTDSWYDSYSPVFSTDGKYLFFVSERDFKPMYSSSEWNHAYYDMARLYFVTLQSDTPSPFRLTSDEVNVSDDTKEVAGTQMDSGFRIDIEGLGSRIAVIPSKAGRYYNTFSNGEQVYFMYRTRTGGPSKMMMYDLAKQKETEIGEFNWFIVSANGKKVLLSKGKSIGITDLPRGPVKSIESAIDLGNTKMLINRKDEWTQIFNECWRQMRDFFYVPNMHGVDWPAIREKYAPLVEHVNHRNDLTYVIGEMIGELNAGHAYVGGGDRPKPERIDMGLLGCQVSKDRSGYFRIDKILKGENWTRDIRSPLTEMGIEVSEGDFMIAINRHDLKDVENMYELLVGQADREVELTLNSKASAEGSKTYIVKPVKDEASLYYYNWVQENIKKVSDATAGQVGYLHIPDMGVRGLNEFAKYYYAQVNKKALIIDVRGNGGGNVSPMIIERLRRELAMVNIARNGVPVTNPGNMIIGPKVTILDQWSASDGDLFPYQFKKYKIGPLVGHRSWGGVVGIRGSLPLMDGGFLNRPEFSRYDTEGREWIIEGYGVDPDIEVDNDLYKEFLGEDQQLDRAIEEIVRLLEERPAELAPIPPYPVKSK